MKLSKVIKGKTVLSVKGDLSVSNAAEFKEILLRALKKAECVELDLGKVTKIDITCVQVLIAAFKSAGAANRQILFKNNIPQECAKSLKATGFAYCDFCLSGDKLNALNGGDKE